MAAQPLYRSDPGGDARNSQDHNLANIPAIDRRPWVVRVRAACRGSGLPLATRAVGLAIASYFDTTGEWSVPEKTLCAELDIHRSTLHRHLTALKEAGILSVDINRTRCNRYATGGAISKMKPAPRAVDGATIRKDATAANVADMRPVRTRSGSPRRTGKLASTSGTQPRHRCGTCSRTWRQKDGERCHGCGGRAIEAIEREEAIQRRIDQRECERLQAEVANRPVTCRRCGNGDARRGDMADTGRCAVCVPLADDEAAALRRKGERLLRQLRESWKSHDDVRGKAAAQELAELYATAR